MRHNDMDRRRPILDHKAETAVAVTIVNGGARPIVYSHHPTHKTDVRPVHSYRHHWCFWSVIPSASCRRIRIRIRIRGVLLRHWRHHCCDGVPYETPPRGDGAGPAAAAVFGAVLRRGIGTLAVWY